MSYAVVATVGAAALSFKSQQDNTSAQSAANRQSLSQDRKTRYEQIKQQEIAYGISNEQAQSKRDFAGQNLGGYAAGGQQAATNQRALLGLGTPEEQATAMAGFQDTPGQQFMRGRAEKALVRNSAKLGGLGGGKVRTALAEQGAQFAAQDYGNHMNRLQNVSSQGMQAANAITSADLGVSKTAGTLVTDRKAAEAAAAAAAAAKKRYKINRKTKNWITDI